MPVSVRLVAVCAFSSALIACLAACNGPGSSATATKGYAVPDYANNRVLIYDAPFSTNLSASVVLGQADFTHGTSAPSYQANTMTPVGVATDSSGNLYVADFEGCRILQFKPPFTNNMNASVVIGEPDFTTRSCTASANTIEFPLAEAIDIHGNLWVAERNTTSRILEFVPPFTNGMSASVVIGQTSLTSFQGCNQGGAASASTNCGSEGLTTDASGDLWVSDSSNERVLEFKPPFTNGMAASVELGQPSATAFTSTTANNGGISASTVDDPIGMAFDASGNLWLADAFNQRVLKYSPPFSNGMAASMELGQPSGTAFTTNTINTSQSGFKYPIGVSFDSSGNMVVTDIQNNRIVIFEPPFSNGMNATLVLGQANFTTGTVNQGGTAGANTLNQPESGTTY